jgi:nicotinamide riboside transporter PnuC
MKKILWQELGKQTLLSIGIFSALFLILYIVEWAMPSLSGVLLQWHDPAFVVGIPASVIGVAYVLTIRNPKNYTGFAGGMVMAVLLAIQFFLLGNFDLVILQLAVFFPFLLISFIRWRRQTLSLSAADQPFYPEWLPLGQRLISLLLLAAIILADYALATIVIQHNAWSDNIILKLVGGLMIASSTLANFILIYQKIDAWVWWVVYALAGMIFYALIGNAFSFVLFTVFLLVNGGAGIAWIKAFKAQK